MRRCPHKTAQMLAVSSRREGNMVANRAYSSGLPASPHRRTSLLYFAAAVPTVGFVYGAADLDPAQCSGARGSLHKARAANRYGSWGVPDHVAEVFMAVASGPAVA